MLSLPDFKEKQIVVALLSYGDRVSFKNDNIIIAHENGIKHQSSCHRLFALFIVGHITITSGILQRSKKFGFSIVMMTHGLIPYGSWFAAAEGNVILRSKQYGYEGNEIAMHIVKNKIERQIAALKKRREKSEKLKNALLKLTEYRARLDEPEEIDLQSLLGMEGIASRVYFGAMFEEIEWHGRQPRAKRDIANLLLDIGYTQLFHLVDAMLGLYGFDTYKGVYHQDFYQRKSLVCDIVEPFRTIIDQRVRKAFALGQVKKEDFSVVSGQYRIFGQDSKPYVRLLLQELLEHKNDIFLYIRGYYRAFMQSKPIEQFPVYNGGS
ncbi:MAG: type V CRISPR-associated endonuclease Cas1 [Campylobacterales bacterium]|nr:type V CRISPR-associated endonuclease Cas1 [Campylobacterales bacterium]